MLKKKPYIKKWSGYLKFQNISYVTCKISIFTTVISLISQKVSWQVLQKLSAENEGQPIMTNWHTPPHYKFAFVGRHTPLLVTSHGEANRPSVMT